MDITQEKVDDLNAILKVKVVSEDYQQKVDDAIKNHRKKANIPGFRPGKVPTGVIKKMYGKSILVDSINNLLSESLQKYLTDNKVELLGQPLPKDTGDDIDWDNQNEFEFSYEMGLAPKFEVKLSSKDKFDYQKIKIDDELVDKYVTDIAKRYGKMSIVEVTEESALIKCDFVELDDAGEIKEGGILKTDATVSPEVIKNEEFKKALIGLKLDNSITVDAPSISENPTDLGATLGINKAVAEKLTSKFKVTVKSISKLEPADINQDLFDKVYGEGNVKSEEEFRAKVKEESANMFENDSDKKLYNDIVDHIMETIKFDLPDQFLKRWIVAANDKPITAEEVEKDYENYSKGMKWQLIENKIIADNKIEVKAEELIAFSKEMIANQFKQYSPEPLSDEQLTEYAQKTLSNQEEAQRIHTQLLGNKMMELFKSTYILEDKEVPFEEFFKQQ